MPLSFCQITIFSFLLLLIIYFIFTCNFKKEKYAGNPYLAFYDTTDQQYKLINDPINILAIF